MGIGDISRLGVAAAAVTHARKDDFFLGMWLSHYSALVGRENCHVILDGDDWDCGVDLSGAQVTHAHGRLGKRIKDDARLAALHTGIIARLLGEGYEYVFRGDCDEFVVVDPAGGLTFEAALAEAREHGHLYMRGLDVIQDIGAEPDLDLSRSVMSQRRWGLIQRHFFKPLVLCQPREIGAGGHSVPGVVKVSGALTLLHLANADSSAMRARFAARQSDFPNGTYETHLAYRGSLCDVMHRGVPPMDYDRAMAQAAHEFSTRGAKTEVRRPQKLRSGNVTVDAGYGPLSAFFVALPDRLREVF